MRFLRAFLVLGLLTISAPVAAQDLRFDPSYTTACVNAAADHNAAEVCFGLSAEHCMRDTPGGFSTVGTAGCLSAEADYWDARLNTGYGALRTLSQSRDEGADANAPSQTDALRDMQRAWISFRDATCGYEASLWAGGTGQGPAFAACRMRLTGIQALYLERQGGA